MLTENNCSRGTAHTVYIYRSTVMMSNESFFLKPAPKWKRFNARFSPIIGFTFSQNRKRNARHFALLLRMCERECANVCVCVVLVGLFERHWFFGTFSYPIMYDIDSSPASFSVKRFHDQYLSKLKQHRWRRLTDNRERHIAENSQHTRKKKARDRRRRQTTRMPKWI